MKPRCFYQVGGTVSINSASYVARSADDQLYQTLCDGEFCYVLTSRQLGKSSLMVRTAYRMRREGGLVAVLDLTAFGQNVELEQWYECLVFALGEKLGREDEVEEYWNAEKHRTPIQRWIAVLVRVALSATKDTRLTVFIDEIDYCKSLPFPTDEFFAAIREIYNRRAQDPRMDRITFCLLGVATPSDLIGNPSMTPFNIGQRIVLRDFTTAEAQPLARGLGRNPRVNSRLFERVMHWTGGHPYLTQVLCRATREEIAKSPPEETLKVTIVDQLCEDLLLSSRARERDPNLLFVRERLLKLGGNRVALLDLYLAIVQGKRVRDDQTSPLMNVLRLSGITKIVRGHHQVRNRIYLEVFDKNWVWSNMPGREKFRQRRAFRKGLARATAFAILLLFVVTVFYVISMRDQRDDAALAREKALDAEQDAEKSREKAEESLERIEKLADLELLNRLLLEEKEMGPADPRAVPRLESWLRRAAMLAEKIEAHRKALSDLREIANPIDAEERSKFVRGLSEGKNVKRLRERRDALNSELALYREQADESLCQATELACEETGQQLAAAEAKLDREVERSFPRRFEHETDQWKHDMLFKLVQRLEAFVDLDPGIGGVARVERRLEFARRVQVDSIERHRDAWQRAIDSIADQSSCPKYRGLVLKPQIGLVPLGQDRDSGLWEFAHIQTGRVAEHHDGKSRVTGESGIVLVLVPGGNSFMGAWPPGVRHRRKEPYVDPMARVEESPVTEVRLAPYFISKYEMTRGQWYRARWTRPSRYKFQYEEELHPVETVSWVMCQTVLSHLGLCLPTEAQWECAARAGTTTPWWTGSDSSEVAMIGNLGPIPRTVGQQQPNPFGLHDVHGNVWEWCRDHYHPGAYRFVLPASKRHRQESKEVLHRDPEDGFIPLDSSGLGRTVRGGGIEEPVELSRSSARKGFPEELVTQNIGVRPARRVQTR